jgi:hypothetical protein
MENDVRLIDANALDLQNRVATDMGGMCFIEEVETAIEQAPTIDPESLRPAWIPVTERLPEENDVYMVSAFDGHARRVTFAQWQNRIKRWYLTGSRSYWKVTHWMPLPEPPEE